MIVLDASVVVKFFLPEAGQAEALALLQSPMDTIHAPDILAIEVAGALVRTANADKAKTKAMQDELASFAELLVGPAITLIRTSSTTMLKAAGAAIGVGHPIKDCIYLILAMELDCPLVTADLRFAEKARGIYGNVRVLGG